ncbi:MAG: hypothetical protein K2X29_14685 [Candidatus Obscuribacterales bacterium]|nr:hypothetical protein [Candidatus Obscuribacterales bacterium]
MAVINLDAPIVLLTAVHDAPVSQLRGDVLINITPDMALEGGAGLHEISEKLDQQSSNAPPSPMLFTRSDITDIGFTAVPAVTRRLSRETAALTCEIELRARELRDQLKNIKVKRLIIHNAEWLDGYTIRVLASLKRLTGGRFECILTFSHDPRTSIQNDDSIQARRSVWEGFCATVGVTLDFAAALPSMPGLYLSCPVSNWEEAKTLIAESIGYLAYDRAFSVIAIASKCAKSNDDLAELNLLKATIYSNLGNHSLSEELLRNGITTARSPFMLSRLHYCLGLVLAKRKYDLNEAAHHFQTGKQLIESADLSNTDLGAVELSWQDNGLALLMSLCARTASKEERVQLLQQAMLKETKALKRLDGKTTPDADYLRFNILANCAFLFEMLGKPQDAIRLFTRLFGNTDNLLSADSPRFRMTAAYRIGVLTLKAANVETAISTLEDSVKSALEVEDYHQAVRIGLALVVAQLQGNHREQAVLNIRRYLKIASKRSDVEMIKQYIELQANVNSAGELARVMRSLSPKLPAYVPLIDLLGFPSQDLNKYLSKTA